MAPMMVPPAAAVATNSDRPNTGGMMAPTVAPATAPRIVSSGWPVMPAIKPTMAQTVAATITALIPAPPNTMPHPSPTSAPKPAPAIPKIKARRTAFSRRALAAVAARPPRRKET